MDTKRFGLYVAAVGGLILRAYPSLAQSWIPTSAPSQGWTAVASSADGKRLAAVTYNGGIYISGDGGTRWTAAGAPRQRWTSIASSADGTKLAAVASPGAIYISQNSGTTWKAVEASSNAWFSAALSSDGSRLIAAADHSGVFLSRDSGATWTTTLNSTNQEWYATACSSDATALAAAADPGPLCILIDGGATWTTSNVPILSWTRVTSSADGVKLAAAAALDGIYTSTNSGANWIKTSAPAEAWSGMAAAADGTRLAATVFNGGIYTSTDGGQTWKKTDAEPMAWSAIACSSDGSNLVATVFNGGIYVPGASSARPGTYQGLFYDTNNLAPESSGFLTASITKQGNLTGKLQLAGKRYSVSGQFRTDGFVSNTITRPKLAPLTVLLQSVSGGNGLAGVVSDGTWTAQLAANRAVYSKTNPPAQAGNKYTMAMAGDGDVLQFGTDPSKPGMIGFGTVTIDAVGNLTFGGTLGDGTGVGQKSFVSKQGGWPLYASPRTGGGVVFGWLTFTNESHNDIDGYVTWFKPSSQGAKLYPAGFTNQTGVAGSLFQPASGVAALNFTTGRVWLVNGNLQSFTNYAVLSTNNVMTGTNKLSLKISGTSGAFKGRIANPETGRSIALNGVVLQKLDTGMGSFPGTNQSGELLLLPGQ
jgi:photosystem II stability/assembly factor-like uncharacterized protein